MRSLSHSDYLEKKMTMKQAQAFAPGDVSCVFKIVPHLEPERMHSLGMSFTVREGVNAVVEHHVCREILFNGAPIDFPTVESVLEKLSASPVRVSLSTPLPLSCGFGLSGASSLSTAFALNALLELGYSNEELAMVAHVAEVENLTGLGDVCAQYHGGFLAKFEPGHPLRAREVLSAETPVFYRYYSALRTDEVLRDEAQKKLINIAGDTALKALSSLLSSGQQPSFSSLIQISRSFAEGSGLIRDGRVRETLDEVRRAGGEASMIMLGNAVFSDTPFNGSTETVLCKNTARLIEVK